MSTLPCEVNITQLLPLLLLSCDLPPPVECAEGVVRSSDTHPDIVVDTALLDFGAIEVGDDSEHVHTVTVRNRGAADLHIQEVGLADPDAPYLIRSIQSVLVPPGEASWFEVEYQPTTAAVDRARVVVDSDDPDTPSIEIPLLGEGIAPVIAADPVSYDFGSVEVGCQDELALGIVNLGNADLVLSGISYETEGAELQLEGIDELDGGQQGLVTLGPAEVEVVHVSYQPLDESLDSAILSISSNDPLNPQLALTQQGEGLYYGTTTDVFQQPLVGSADIIFALDSSGSMEDDLDGVLSNLTTFVSALLELDLDFHVAVTLADDGCIAGPDAWIHSGFSTDEVEAAIKAMADNGGQEASNAEAAFTLLEACLAEASSGGCNEGLLRDAAVLHLVGISDEPEQSAYDWSAYVALFQSYKDDADDLVIHAVGGDYPGGCGGGTATAYTGMYEATVATGGQFLSFCATDWASGLEVIADEAGLERFPLSQEPVSETIVVRVDGVPCSDSWTYDEEAGAVVFDSDHLPTGGANVEIEYATKGDCG